MTSRARPGRSGQPPHTLYSLARCQSVRKTAPDRHPELISLALAFAVARRRSSIRSHECRSPSGGSPYFGGFGTEIGVGRGAFKLHRRRPQLLNFNPHVFARSGLRAARTNFGDRYNIIYAICFSPPLAGAANVPPEGPVVANVGAGWSKDRVKPPATAELSDYDVALTAYLRNHREMHSSSTASTSIPAPLAPRAARPRRGWR